jgi:hypothetical protein
MTIFENYYVLIRFISTEEGGKEQQHGSAVGELL